MINKDLVSIKDLDRKEIEKILKTASAIEKLSFKKQLKIASGKILAVLFFESSTRTRLSFETAMHRLGGSVIGFSDPESTSQNKGETLEDTIKIVAGYADIIVIRHPEAGSAKIAAQFSKVPVINAGDGANQHPTQTLIDLYTIQKEKRKIDGLNVGMLGDLKYGRTIHSLSWALADYNVKQYFISHRLLKIPLEYKNYLKKQGRDFFETNSLLNVLPKLDVLYVTRVQKERFPRINDYHQVKDAFVIGKKIMKKAKKDCIVMHPLPRVEELLPDLDETPFAKYFQQAKNGVPIRMALIKMLLGL